MLMVCHHLDPSIPEDVAFAESRIRARPSPPRTSCTTWAPFYDLVGLAGHGPGWRGDHPHLADGRQDEATARSPRIRTTLTDRDNFRVKRYIAKYTINPAIAHGIEPRGRVHRVGKLADLCLWKPALFGAKPEMVIKGGRSHGRRWATPTPASPRPNLW